MQKLKKAYLYDPHIFRGSFPAWQTRHSLSPRIYPGEKFHMSFPKPLLCPRRWPTSTLKPANPAYLDHTVCQKRGVCVWGGGRLESGWGAAVYLTRWWCTGGWPPVPLCSVPWVAPVLRRGTTACCPGGHTRILWRWLSLCCFGLGSRCPRWRRAGDRCSSHVGYSHSCGSRCPPCCLQSESREVTRLVGPVVMKT